MKHSNTKTMKIAFARWMESNYYSLGQCYANPSPLKEEAWRRCVDLSRECKGEQEIGNAYIIGFNSQTFSVGFTGEIDGKRAFFYITRDYDRYIYLDEI